MTFDPITNDRMRDWLQYIFACHMEKGRPPSVRELQDEFDISSTSVVNYTLQKMVQAGYLEHEPFIARGIKVTDDGLEFMRE